MRYVTAKECLSHRIVSVDWWTQAVAIKAVDCRVSTIARRMA